MPKNNNAEEIHVPLNAMVSEMYFQTWTWNCVARKFFGEKIYMVTQAVCGFFTDHQPSKTEWGFGGEDEVDTWCRWCNKPGKMKIEEAVKIWPQIRGMSFKHFGVDPTR